MSLCVAGSTGIDWNRNRLQELQECENKKRILLLSFFQAKKKQGAIIHIWWRLFRLSRSVFGGILQLCPLGAVLKVTCYKQVSDKLYQGLSWKEKGGTESFSFAAGRLWEENPFSHQLWPVRHFLGEAEHEFLRAAVRSGGGSCSVTEWQTGDAPGDYSPLCPLCLPTPWNHLSLKLLRFGRREEPLGWQEGQTKGCPPCALPAPHSHPTHSVVWWGVWIFTAGISSEIATDYWD